MRNDAAPEGATTRSAEVKIPNSYFLPPNFFYSVVGFLLILLFFSCSQKEIPPVNMEQTPVISGSLGWAVVTMAYIMLKTEPAYEAGDSSAVRKGDVLKIIARRMPEAGTRIGPWYKVDFNGSEGWLNESSLALYKNESQARKAAGK
jgi:hypothetical protein